MPLLLHNKVYNHYRFTIEADFEKLVEKLSDYIFGTSTIYISKKKRIKGADIISIPDAYLIDMTDPTSPSLYVIENEIVSHDPFKHIGIQLLRFATSFEDARLELRKHLMDEIVADAEKQRRLQAGCDQSAQRNIDSYLDQAVYGEFKALVLIDEARPELHNVIQKINADISVLELRSFVADDGSFIYEYDTFYEDDDADIIEEAPTHEVSDDKNEARLRRRARRAQCDTIVVPAQEEGFKREFLGNNQWYAVRIGAAMKERIKYIATYQVAPVSAITHVAEVEFIQPYQNTGKYLLKFKGPAQSIKPVGLKSPDKKPQGPVYVKYADLLNAGSLDELMEY